MNGFSAIFPKESSRVPPNAISEKKIHDNFILFHSERSTRIQLFMQELIIEFLGSPAESSVDVIGPRIW